MMKRSKSRWSSASARSLLTLACVAVLAPAAPAQQLEGQFRLNGAEVTKAFEPLRSVLQQSSAVILEGWKSVGFGVVISSDGYLVTKASELNELKSFSVRIDKKEYKDVEVCATSAEWDVALLKVDGVDLVPVDWAEGDEPVHGSWVVSNGATSRLRRRARVGIISANAREIGGGTPVVLGVQLENEKDKIVIGEVREDSGADAAGLKKGDVIIEADGKELEKREDLLNILGKKEPGDVLDVTVLREEEKKEFQVELKAREKVFEGPRTRNDAMSGRTSERRTNFKRVLQHDIGLSERSAGGPLLDLNGKCVGMNIARANRAETFAIPAAEMQEVIHQLFQKAE